MPDLGGSQSGNQARAPLWGSVCQRKGSRAAVDWTTTSGVGRFIGDPVEGLPGDVQALANGFRGLTGLHRATDRSRARPPVEAGPVIGGPAELMTQRGHHGILAVARYPDPRQDSPQVAQKSTQEKVADLCKRS